MQHRHRQRRLRGSLTRSQVPGEAQLAIWRLVLLLVGEASELVPIEEPGPLRTQASREKGSRTVADSSYRFSPLVQQSKYTCHVSIGGQVHHGSVTTREEDRIEAEKLLVRYLAEITWVLQRFNRSEPFGHVLRPCSAFVLHLISDGSQLLC